MNLKDLTQDELETMGYDEIAQLILEETGKKEKLLNLYKKVCKLLKLDFESQAENITEFFELLSVNKKFIMLDNGYWDLQVNHKVKIVVEDSEEELVEIEEVEEKEEIEEVEEEIFYNEEAEDDNGEDDLASFAIISEDDEEASE